MESTDKAKRRREKETENGLKSILYLRHGFFSRGCKCVRVNVAGKVVCMYVLYSCMYVPVKERMCVCVCVGGSERGICEYLFVRVRMRVGERMFHKFGLVRKWRELKAQTV